MNHALNSLRVKAQTRAATLNLGRRFAACFLGFTLGAFIPPAYDLATRDSFRFEVRAPSGQAFTVDHGLSFEDCLDRWSAFEGANIGIGCKAESARDRFAALVRR
jgi:hypothetical protein